MNEKFRVEFRSSDGWTDAHESGDGMPREGFDWLKDAISFAQDRFSHTEWRVITIAASSAIGRESARAEEWQTNEYVRAVGRTHRAEDR